MPYSLIKTEENNDDVIILDKKGNVLFSNADSHKIQIVKDYGIDNLLKINNSKPLIKDCTMKVYKIKESSELGYVLIFRKIPSTIQQVLSPYKELNSIIYSNRLIDEIKNGVIKLDFFENYSIVIINIDCRDKAIAGQECMLNDDALKNFETTVVRSIREVDIPIRSRSNEFVIITPVVRRDYLKSFVTRIQNELQQINILMNMEFEISIGVSSNAENSHFIEVLKNAHKDLYAQKRKLMLLKLEEELEVLNKIEIVRAELHNLIEFDKNNMHDDEIVELSQYLDKLLAEYMRNLGEMDSEEKK